MDQQQKTEYVEMSFSLKMPASVLLALMGIAWGSSLFLFAPPYSPFTESVEAVPQLNPK